VVEPLGTLECKQKEARLGDLFNEKHADCIGISSRTPFLPRTMGSFSNVTEDGSFSRSSLMLLQFSLLSNANLSKPSAWP